MRRRLQEISDAIESADGNDMWEIANNEGPEIAAQLDHAIDLLEAAVRLPRTDEWLHDVDKLVKWANSESGYGDEPAG